MFKKYFSIAVLGYLLILQSSTTHARDSSINIAVSTEYDSNVLRQKNEKSDTAIKVAPAFNLLGIDGKKQYTLKYQSLLAKFKDESILDYNNHLISLGAKFDHGYRLSTEFKLNYKDVIESPGTNSASTQTLTGFIEYKDKNAEAKLTYGKNTSQGQLVLSLKHLQRKFNNTTQPRSDLNKNELATQFFYRVSPKIRALIEVEIESFDYKALNVLSNLSSTNTNYLLGVKWDVTDNSSGTFKLGYQKKSYDNDELFNDISGLSYSLDMFWLPSSYSKVTLGTSRLTTESAQLGIGGFIREDFSIKLEHQLTGKTSFNANAKYSEDDITNTLNRTDNITEISAGLTHRLTRWLDVDLSVKKHRRNSNVNEFIFDANMINLSFKTFFN
jgi:hypothetical protein